ncbi:MAG: hypothetical protein K2Z81_22320 [Cyanobacteria bacterium]|nr:hypothetical protein [Cyanobacteriota bacterium]
MSTFNNDESNQPTLCSTRIELVQRICLDGKIGSITKDSNSNRLLVVLEKQEAKDSDLIIFETTPDGMTEKLRLSISALELLDTYYDHSIELEQQLLLKKINSSDPYTPAERARFVTKYESIKDLKGETKKMSLLGSRAIFVSDRMIFVAVETENSNIVGIVDCETGRLLSKLDIGQDFESMLSPCLIEPELIALPYQTGLKMIELPSFKTSKVARQKNEDYNVISCLYREEENRLYLLWGVIYAGELQTFLYDKNFKTFQSESKTALNATTDLEAAGLSARPGGGAIITLNDVQSAIFGGLLWFESQDNEYSSSISPEWAAPLGWRPSMTARKYKFRDGSMFVDEASFLRWQKENPSESLLAADGQLYIEDGENYYSWGDGPILSAGDQAVLVDNQQVLINVANHLVGIDSQNKSPQLWYSTNSNIRLVDYNPELRLLLIGCEDGSLELLSVQLA